jgi:thermosome
MAMLAGQPVMILSDKTQRTRGRDARRMNILAGRVIAEALKTTLGPKGMDKMLVDSLGDIMVTNDGVSILKQIDIEHPAAKMIVEVAKTQEDAVGDGTTTAVVIAGGLLQRAEELIDQQIHPTVITEGYRRASEKAVEVLERIAIPVRSNDVEILKKVAITAMTGKGVERESEHLAALVVEAVMAVAEEGEGGIRVDTGDIKVEKKAGGGIRDTSLVHGIVIDKERVHSAMPKRVEGAKIALVDASLEVKKTEVDAKIRISDPSQMKAFVEEEERMLHNMVQYLQDAGANVLFCQKGIDDLVQHDLSKAGIFAVRRVKKSDMEKLSRATGGRIITKLKEISSKDLGEAGLVEEVKIGDDEMTFVRQCRNPKSVSLLIRGGTEQIVDEVERSVNDALGVVPAALEDGKVVAGGGAPEVEVAKELRKYAKTVGGRKQLAIEAFADGVETIPMALASNAGLDPIDTMVSLRAKHEKDGPTYGINVFTGKPERMEKKGVLEPLRVKTQAIHSATEVAIMILRIDDVIASSGKGEISPPAGGDEE